MANGKIFSKHLTHNGNIKNILNDLRITSNKNTGVVVVAIKHKKSDLTVSSKPTIKICIVGDILRNFSNHKNAITISKLENFIINNQLDINVAKYDIHVGLGVSSSRLNDLRECIANSKLSELLQINTPAVLKNCNTSPNIKIRMISEPKQITYNEYESMLVIEDDCAGMAEPFSGRHIQGMLLVEAARQMAIAVAEKYHFNNEIIGKRDFVTHSMDTVFHKFIYPLDVSIRYKIKELKQTSNINTTCKGIVSILQNGDVASEVTFKMSVIDSEFIAEKEAYLADRCLKEHLQLDMF